MKTLVIGPSWVGDMMMSQCLYRTLKVIKPNTLIDVIAPAWSGPLLNKMPEVNQLIEMPIGHGELALKERYNIGKHMQDHDYDRAYVLPNSFKSALIPFFAKIPDRIGWRGEMRYGLLNDIRVLDKKAFPLMVQRYAALAFPKKTMLSADNLPNPLLYPKLQVLPADIALTQSQLNISDLSSPLIGFCPGAEFGPAKRWPDYHYAQLADLLIEQGYQIAIFGSKNDLPVANAIIEKSHYPQNMINLAGRTNLEQVVNLIASCTAVVTNDSGLMHIAASLDRPLIALYGPSSPDFTPPLSSKAQVIRLITGYHRVRKGDAEQGYHQSLIDIKPELVFEKLITQLKAEN